MAITGYSTREVFEDGTVLRFDCGDDHMKLHR